MTYDILTEAAPLGILLVVAGILLIRGAPPGVSASRVIGYALVIIGVVLCLSAWIIDQSTKDDHLPPKAKSNSKTSMVILSPPATQREGFFILTNANTLDKSY